MSSYREDRPEKARQKALFFGEPWPKRGRKKGQIDPTTIAKFVRIVKLRKAGKTWPEIDKALNSEFIGQKRGSGACKELFRSYLPSYVEWYRNHFHLDDSEEDLLRIARAAIKGKVGRPKKSKD